MGVVFNFFTIIIVILNVNVRGLGRPEKRLTIRKMVKKHKVDVLLLQETKVGYDIHSVIRDIWGNKRCAWDWVPAVGTLGGLINI